MGPDKKRKVSLQDPRSLRQMHLSSFDIKLSRSDPYPESVPKGVRHDTMIVSDSGDAYSVSYLPGALGPSPSVSRVDRKFMLLDPAYLKRLLLRILDEEEYGKVIAYHENREHTEYDEEYYNLPPDEQLSLLNHIKYGKTVRNEDQRSQVRITDLRLAEALRPADLKRELELEISSLPLPFSADEVLHWKWKTLSTYKTHLKSPKEWSEQEASNERTRVLAISFSAAALLLLHDLDHARLGDNASHGSLIEDVAELQDITASLISSLNNEAQRLHTLLRSERKAGRRPDPGEKGYRALHMYRMGRGLKDVARRVGITPARRVDGELKGSRDWKAKLSKILAEGVQAERENFPEAVEIFEEHEDLEVREMARYLYDEYTHAWRYGNMAMSIPEFVDIEMDEDLLLGGLDVDSTEEAQRALIQLGSCLENDIPIFPDLS